MQPPDYTWLAGILIAARQVRNFVDGVDRDEFDGKFRRWTNDFLTPMTR